MQMQFMAIKIRETSNFILIISVKIQQISQIQELISRIVFMSDIDKEGFQSPKHQYHFQKDNILVTKCKNNVAKSILKQTHYSLEPDMLMGWKPKLPSCPLPLTYLNYYNQKLMQLIPKDDRFKIVYQGRRYVNSVHVNQQYNYYWRYRQRYSLNLALIEQDVKKQERENNSLYEEKVFDLSKKQIKFDSSFQSGNLELAVKVKPNQYDLFLRSDTNTKGHTNWYYFKVNNQDFLGKLQINICNLGKTKALYNKGMKPYVYEKKQQEQQIDLTKPERWGSDKTSDVCFVQRYCRFGTDRKTFQLQFKYNFTKTNSQVYFAYGIPYTYSQLEDYIKEICCKNKSILKYEKLTESLGGLNIPLLTISSEEYISESLQNKENKLNQINTDQSHGLKSLFEAQELSKVQKKQKKAVLLTGRIHPGQSNASHVLQGFINQLLGTDEMTKKIRQKYVFYIIPMINPDGVVAGNFRTSYSGKDLNRQFKRLNKYVYPQIFALDQLCSTLKQRHKRKLQFYFDFHGHSSKKNLFCYGPEYQPSNMLFFKCRTFSKIIQEINPIFSYRKSIFHISESKKATGRAHMLWIHRIPMTFTFQISNGLYDTKQQKNIHLNSKSMREAGKAIYKGLERYIFLQNKGFMSYNAKAKVDTGIRSRKMLSEKNVREKSLKISRIYTSPLAIESTEVLVYKKSLQITKIQQQNVGFDKYIRQIKKQSAINSQEQGGSDSEGSQEDLSKEQLEKLHEFVEERGREEPKQQSQKIYNFKIKPVRVKKQVKQRKFSIQQNSVDESNKENIRLENIKMPKIRSSSSNGIDSGRRLYNLAKRIPQLKRPPLPIPVVYEKVVLCQKKFTVQF